MIAILLLLSASALYGSAPSLFFTDLTSAPSSGGETVSSFTGAYVTIYGNNFGASQGASTVTWNGIDCLRVVGSAGTYTGWGSTHLWYQKIIVQLSTSCTAGTGNFVVATSSGASNGLSFTVRTLSTNKIYFVATGGSNSNAGTFAAPFLTIPKCMGSGDTSSVMRAGDVCYVRDGVNQTAIAGFASLTPNAFAGTASLPISLVTYPGANSTIGTDNVDKGLQDCVGYVPQCDTVADQYLIIAGFHVRGQTYAVSIQGANNRVVALEVQCPAATRTPDMPGCFNTINSFETVYGNEVSNVGVNLLPSNAGKYQHQFYFGAGHDFEIGWNYSHDANGGRLVQFYNGSSASYNINFHDNVLHDNVNVDGMTLDANPGLGGGGGYVNVYNNVIYNAGKAPASNPDYGGTTCLFLQSTGSTPSVAVHVYNNTFYNCGTTANGNVRGAINPGILVQMDNNIVQQTTSSLPYLSTGGAGPASNVSGTKNVWFGGGTAPTQTSSNVTSDPQLIAPGSDDLHIGSASPARDAGTTISGLLFDIDGNPRPAGGTYDIGAYEFVVSGQRIIISGKHTWTGRVAVQ